MKTKLAFCTLLSTILLSFTTVTFANDILFQDNFSKMDPAWGTPNPEKRIEHNAFILEPNLGMTYDVVNQAGLYQDMDYSVDVKLAKGDGKDFGGGSAFWAKDVNDYYFLYILTDGSYYIGRYAGGRYLYPVSTTKDPAIKPGVGAVNNLRVVTKGNQATIYINGKQMITFSGQVPDGGGLIGLAGDSGKTVKNTWEFSNLKVSKP